MSKFLGASHMTVSAWIVLSGESQQMIRPAPVDHGFHIGDVVGPCICLAGALAAVAGVFFYALFDLSRPTVIPNPGVDAYHAPPATVLGPSPRISGAYDTALEPFAPGDTPASAPAPASPDPAKDAQASARKHARTPHEPAHDSGLRAFGYVQPPGNQWNQWGGYRGGWSNNATGFAAPARQRMYGGPKSPF